MLALPLWTSHLPGRSWLVNRVGSSIVSLIVSHSVVFLGRICIKNFLSIFLISLCYATWLDCSFALVGKPEIQIQTYGLCTWVLIVFCFAHSTIPHSQSALYFCVIVGSVIVCLAWASCLWHHTGHWHTGLFWCQLSMFALTLSLSPSWPEAWPHCFVLFIFSILSDILLPGQHEIRTC